jgi:hypothetical protein
MDARSEAIFSFLAALLVLISALLDARVAAAIAVILLLVFSIYKYVGAHHQQE